MKFNGILTFLIKKKKLYEFAIMFFSYNLRFLMNFTIQYLSTYYPITPETNI